MSQTLLSGGVGLTPMVAMLETIAEHHPGLSAYYIHGTHDRETHAMRDHVRGLAHSGNAVRVVDFRQTPMPGEAAGEDYDHAGIITDDRLVAKKPVGEADYYVCGPRPFLRAAVSGVSLAGVASERIHYEFFGPADELLAA